MDEETILEVLNAIRDECGNTEHCRDCRFACKYHADRVERYACVLKETPERWQLETMEGFYNGEES